MNQKRPMIPLKHDEKSGDLDDSIELDSPVGSRE